MPYFTLRKKLAIRSKEYNIYCKTDVIHGALIKIAELGPSRRAAVSKIYATLDVALEICDRLGNMEHLYNEYRPLPRDGRLKYDEIVEPESTYQLDLSVIDYRQCLRITQSKPRLTRGPSDTISIADIADFRRELTGLLDELCSTHFVPSVNSDDGVNKVVRGNRAAVIYSPIRPWPWTRSYPAEQLLFDPNLVALIIFERDVARIRDYCERVYPDLMVDAYVDMNYDPNEWNTVFESLKVRWIRRGQKFRVNDRLGTIVLKKEDRWFTA